MSIVYKVLELSFSLDLLSMDLTPDYHVKVKLAAGLYNPRLHPLYPITG